MKVKIFGWAFIAIGFIASSCSKDDEVDNIKPTIVLTAPANNDTVKVVDLHFAAELSDVSGLKNYKVDIHSAEGHEHPSTRTMGDWRVVKELSLGGQKNHSAHEHFEIPDTAPAGNYHFIIYCTDLAGNEAMAVASFYLAADRHDEPEH